MFLNRLFCLVDTVVKLFPIGILTLTIQKAGMFPMGITLLPAKVRGVGSSPRTATRKSHLDRGLPVKKSIFLFLLFTLSACSRSGYSGHITDEKSLRNGALVIDLDGTYPDQKMTLYLSPNDAATIGALPAIGSKIEVTGETTTYKGRPEIKIHSANQWHWER